MGGGGGAASPGGGGAPECPRGAAPWSGGASPGGGGAPGGPRAGPPTAGGGGGTESRGGGGAETTVATVPGAEERGRLGCFELAAPLPGRGGITSLGGLILSDERCSSFFSAAGTVSGAVGGVALLRRLTAGAIVAP